MVVRGVNRLRARHKECAAMGTGGLRHITKADHVAGVCWCADLLCAVVQWQHLFQSLVQSLSWLLSVSGPLQSAAAGRHRAPQI